MNKRNSYLVAGLVMTGILTVLIVMGIFWTPYDPNAMAAGPKLSPPSLAHLMGTDSFGRDIFSRVLKGAGTTYGIALCTVAIGAVCGTMLGAVTGYFGGIVDDVLMRLGDVLTAFPIWFFRIICERLRTVFFFASSSELAYIDTLYPIRRDRHKAASCSAVLP